MRVLSVRVDQGGRCVEQPKWEWMDSAFGMIVGAITSIVGLMGWINRKLETMQASHDHEVTTLHERVTPLMEDVAELRAHHESKMQRLANIEASMQVIDRKQDEQMRMLYRLVGEKMRRDE